MTVKDLITELRRLPEDMNIYTEGDIEYFGQTLNSVFSFNVINVEDHFGHKLPCDTETGEKGILIS